MIRLPDYFDLIGIPFKECGRSLIEGIDCTGLVLEVYHRAGYSDSILFSPERNNYYWKTVEIRDIKPMDVVFMHDEEHVALYVDRDTILHSKPKVGVILSKLTSRSIYVNRIQRLTKCSL